MKSDGSNCSWRICVWILFLGLFALATVGCERERSVPSNYFDHAKVSDLLKFGIRYSLLAKNTGVLQLENQSSESTPPIILNYRNQDSGKTLRYQVSPILPKALVEIGILESGWKLEANEVVTVSVSGYEDESLYVFKDDNGRLVMTSGYGAKKGYQILKTIEKVLK